MRTIVKLTLVVFVVLSLVAAIVLRSWHTPIVSGHPSVTAQTGLIVHEWGTFTSIAGKDGVALEWRPLNGSSDLPKFIHSLQNAAGLRHSNSKDQMTALIRMETPVIYFYSDREMDVSAKVNFPKGQITEWYPHARTVGGGIDWGSLKVVPDAAFSLPVGYDRSHYYAARDTDAAPLQVCGSRGKPAEQEKFLFYRGVGNFELPLVLKLNADHLAIANRGTDEISQLLVFENRGGKVGYTIINSLRGEQTIERPILNRNLESLISDLTESLVNAGLYRKEAEAMIKTWRDSWFEEGMRVFYVLPRATTDAVLPIDVEPKPAQMVRVLVGRAEMITPEMEKSVKQQVSRLADPSPRVRAEALFEIRKYGRFSEPILKELLLAENDKETRTRINQLIAVSVKPSE